MNDVSSSGSLRGADPRALVVAGESIFPLGEQIAPPQGTDARHREPHVHPDMLQVLLATSGACFCEIDRLRLAGRAPVLITIPGGGVHGFETDGVSTGWAATIGHARVIDLVVNRNLDIGFLLRRAYVVAPPTGDREAGALEQAMRALCEEAHEPREGSALAMEALQQLVLLHAARVVRAGQDLAGGEEQGERELFLAFRARVEQHFLEQRRVADYIAALGCTQTRLNRACVRFAGQSAKGVILERLAEEAQRRLIFTRTSATKIGYALGFVEPSYFLRFFRKRTGMTPAQYRARHVVR